MPQAVEDLDERKTLRDLLDEDRWRDSSELRDLLDWVHRAAVAYLAAQCDPQALAREASGFVGVLRAFLEAERDSERNYADEGLIKKPPESTDDVAQARRHVEALERMLKRLK